MNQKIVIFAMGFALLVAAQLAVGQQAGKVYRIGYISHIAGPFASDAAFSQALRDLGWIKGQNIAVEYRWLAGKRDRLPALAAELVDLNVDLFVVKPSFVVREVKKATSTIPIVMMQAADAVENGLVASLAQPGGNVTGMSESLSDIYTKLLELLHETLPKATRVGFLLEPRRKAHARAAKKLQSVDPTVEVAEFRGSEEIEKALQTSLQTVDALVVPGPLYTAYGRQISDFTVKNRMPVFSVGGTDRAEPHSILLVYAPDWSDMGRRAATYVDKILRGAKPSDLPVGRPTKFNLAVNLKAAKALGLTIPPIILYQADKVIQ